MLTAYAMREINLQLKIQLAGKTAKEIALGLYSEDVRNALKYITNAVQERRDNGLPYPASSFSINVSTALGKPDHYPELITVLRNLGYTVSTSHSTNWGNEQLTISW
jgi:hypothetical protein